MPLLGDNLAGVDTDGRTLYIWGEMIIDSANSETQSISEGIGDSDAGVEIHRSEGQTRDDIYLGVENWVELFPFVVRSSATGPSDFEGVGDSDAGIEIHREPGDTRDGTYVDRDYWVELFGEDIIYEQRLQGSDGEYISNGQLGTVYVLVQYLADDGTDFGGAELTIENTDTENVLYSDDVSSSYDPSESRIYIVSETAPDGHDLSGDEIKVDLNVTTHRDGADWKLSFGNTLESDHVHSLEPGIIETFNETELHPENCDVIVNGTPMEVSFGDGNAPFREKVDLLAKIEELDSFDGLNEGTINRVEVTSDGIGHLEVYVEGDVYRQILGNG